MELIEKPGLTPTFTYITDQNYIKRRLVEWQHFHYAQAGETPFDRKEWHNRINPTDLSDEEILAIVHGKHATDPSLHTASKKILEKIVRTSSQKFHQHPRR